MTYSELAQLAMPHFNDVDVVYITNDGQVFSSQKSAMEYASAKGAQVFEFKKSELQKTEDEYNKQYSKESSKKNSEAKKTNPNVKE